MTAQRKVGSITITANAAEGTVLFEHDDGRKGTVMYAQSPGVTEDDVAYSYDEEDAMRVINDDNCRDTEAYQDASIQEARERGVLR